MTDEWFWDYIELDLSPSFYRIWDLENNTIAHIEIDQSFFFDGKIERIVNDYNQMKSLEYPIPVTRKADPDYHGEGVA